MSGSLTDHVIHLRLPLKPEYLPVFRATAGVIAGVINFNYDEIMQIRVAVSEVFEQAVRCVTQERPNQEVIELGVKFLVQQDGLELLITIPAIGGDHISHWVDEEGQAVISSLMDKVELSSDDGTVRMTKYRSAVQSR